MPGFQIGGRLRQIRREEENDEVAKDVSLSQGPIFHDLIPTIPISPLGCHSVALFPKQLRKLRVACEGCRVAVG